MTAVLAPPKFLFPYVNLECNLRCLHCMRWQDYDPKPEARITIDRICEITEEFAELAPGAGVVICGGETLLAWDDYFQLCACCRRLGLHSYSVTNGMLVDTTDIAEYMMCEGPDEITVSLDSPDEVIHDRLRGKKGSYQAAVRALRLLVAARRMTGHLDDRRVYAMGLICDVNYKDMDRFYDLVLRDIGADKLKCNPLQPTCEIRPGAGDRFFAEHVRVPPEEFMEIMRACDVKYKLGLDPEWIRHMGVYFRAFERNYQLLGGWGAGARTREHICNTHDRNIMVDLKGTARLCFSTKYPGMPLVERGDLRRFWERPETEALREQMRQCNDVCGVSHSVRRVNATLKPSKVTP
jgi:MoaA/NifB/PqqE/SkfB family radical SAM enzyme